MVWFNLAQVALLLSASCFIGGAKDSFCPVVSAFAPPSLVTVGQPRSAELISSGPPSARKASRSFAPSTELPAISFGTRRRKDATSPDDGKDRPDKRFERVAAAESHIDAPCVLTINGMMYNMTAWARAHPGGAKVLQKFHGRDATKAFDAAGHSDTAYAMLKDFEIGPAPVDDSAAALSSKVRTISDLESDTSAGTIIAAPSTSSASADVDENRVVKRKVPRWRAKLFTKEDPIGLHKYMGVFCLLHFVYRHAQMLFGDPSCGMGTRMGKGPALIPILCMIPHGVLSLSSLIFHTVPRERVVGKPMIWQEFRAHNIIFGMRSVLCTVLAWACIYSGQNPLVRKVAVTASALSVLIANAGAGFATAKLRQNNQESTTATMPYWDGCSLETQKKFKSFYAYSQFLATLGCITCANPAWPLTILLAIQLASLLMTLVRKGIISARAYHVAYTASLCMPYLVGARHLAIMKSWDFPALLLIGSVMYQLRRRGVNKYALWTPVVVARIAIGDQFINWGIW